jgi:shikimate 5-dehydrogenase
MNEETKQVGLIGWPIAHSLSPAMHNAAFAELGLEWAYVLMPVQSGHIEPALKELLAKNFVGANVTMPHKQAVMPHLNELSDAALCWLLKPSASIFVRISSNQLSYGEIDIPLEPITL